MTCTCANLTKIQARVVESIERARSQQIATGNYTVEYGKGYAQAKRDCLTEIAIEFEQLRQQQE